MTSLVTRWPFRYRQPSPLRRTFPPLCVFGPAKKGGRYSAPKRGPRDKFLIWLGRFCGPCFGSVFNENQINVDFILRSYARGHGIRVAECSGTIMFSYEIGAAQNCVCFRDFVRSCVRLCMRLRARACAFLPFVCVHVWLRTLLSCTWW